MYWFLQQNLQEKIVSLEGELKTTQTSMHTFYVSQMESILSEKVATLQKNVSEWEKSFNAEKLKDIQQIKKQHQEQLESIQQE
jgi:hypothetical protein